MHVWLQAKTVPNVYSFSFICLLGFVSYAISCWLLGLSMTGPKERMQQQHAAGMYYALCGAGPAVNTFL